MAFTDNTLKINFENTLDKFTEKVRLDKNDYSSSKNSEKEIGSKFIKKSAETKGDIFKDKSGSFLTKSALFFDMAKLEDNEAGISTGDDKVIILLTHAKSKTDEKAFELKKESRVIGKQIKQSCTEKTVKKDNNVFQESDAQFSDKYNNFSRTLADRFKLIEQGNDLFLPNKKESVTSEIINEKFVNKSQRRLSSQAEFQTGLKTEETDKFSKTTIKKDDNKSQKRVNSYFSERVSEKSEYSEAVNGKEERLKEQKKNIKKEYSKETKKAARIAAVSNFLRVKKTAQNDLANVNGNVSGDLLKDGAGVLSVIKESLMNLFRQKIKMVVINACAAFFGFLSSILSVIAPFIVIVVTVFIIATNFFSIFIDGIDIPQGDGYTYAALSSDEIDTIIENLYLLYDDMGSTQEALLRYSLSKVGCEYNQNYHWSLTENIFDCSSLAYRSYLEIGYDISNRGIYSAAEECRKVINNNYLVNDELKPGDLIFYGGRNNDRYMGVYHVAIYVGDGKMVEARGTSWGVVYCDIRSNNVVAYGRYI